MMHVLRDALGVLCNAQIYDMKQIKMIVTEGSPPTLLEFSREQEDVRK